MCPRVPEAWDHVCPSDQSLCRECDCGDGLFLLWVLQREAHGAAAQAPGVYVADSQWQPGRQGSGKHPWLMEPCLCVTHHC